MSWEIAQEHVLRMPTRWAAGGAAVLLLCIDGIDHAARARPEKPS